MAGALKSFGIVVQLMPRQCSTNCSRQTFDGLMDNMVVAAIAGVQKKLQDIAHSNSRNVIVLAL